MRIDADNLHYRELNQRIRQAVAAGERSFELANVNGQRYLADGLKGEITLDIHGVPGNDLGAFMDGPTIRVHDNAQDAVGNTMNAGRIIVHGHAGDVLGYGMRGGELLVRGDVGYRVGIHMKAFGDRQPVVIAGGAAGDFLGEYMAGGLLMILGLERRPSQPLVGNWCATGMHGGAIYLRTGPDLDLSSGPPAWLASQFAAIAPAQESDRERMRPHLEAFCQAFSLCPEDIAAAPFLRIAPRSHRPFGAKYATY